jgi:aminoglycoside phosphotransferase (APT) family kinase protein
MEPDGGVAAVLDWELCTLGDVLADVAAMIAYSDERASSGMGLPMSADGFPSPDEIRHLYEEVGSRSLVDLDFYIAFAYWRTACIIEGVYTRYAAGAMGADTDPQAIEAFGQRTVVLADLAREAAARLPGA